MTSKNPRILSHTHHHYYKHIRNVGQIVTSHNKLERYNIDIGQVHGASHETRHIIIREFGMSGLAYSQPSGMATSAREGSVLSLRLRRYID